MVARVELEGNDSFMRALIALIRMLNLNLRQRRRKADG
jgi:hypothetical protein